MSSFDLEQLNVRPNDKTILREFVLSWERHKHPVLFVGAGVSKYCAIRRPDIGSNSKFSSWIELLDDLKHRLSNGDEEIAKRLSTDPLRLAQLFQEQFGRAALLDVIDHHVPSADFMPGEEHNLLRAFPWAAVVTTNYDDLLERAFETSRRVRKVVVDEDLTQPRSLEDLLVIKMHGDLAVRDSIVLTEEDYRQYVSRRPGISIKVRQLLTEHPLLFIGFSLSDPHFVTIDGWIRDTLRRVRLPAVSIVHSEALPAERSMWKARGIELVELPRPETLLRLLTALRSERKPPHGQRQQYNHRVTELEGRASAIAQERSLNRPERLASILQEIVTGAKADADNGAASAGAIRWFCWGWHNILHRAEKRQVDVDVITARDVFNALSDGDRQQLLIFALETGIGTLRIDGTSVIDIGQELLRNPNAYRLTNDERALICLYVARIQRAQGATDPARVAVEAARAANPGTSIKALLSAEAREILFQDGDAKGIEAELRRPLDEGSDVLAMCRRGADSLLLRQRHDASQWYGSALERARNGDEQYVALWGKLACERELLSTDPNIRAREAELFAKLHAIPKGERPISQRAQDFVQDAGSVLLDGGHKEGAIEKLTEFLSIARRLGWPHSPEHNVSYLVESVARRAARLLLRVEDSAETDIDAIKEGLALISRYGLAKDIPKLFVEQHWEALSRKDADVDWFRRFCRVRPTLSRPADARLTAMYAGIPLLIDAEIEGAIEILIQRTEAWRAGGRETDADLITIWWDLLATMHEHLPRDAVKRIFVALGSCLTERKTIFRIKPRNLSFEIWMKQGFLTKGDVETTTFIRAATDALRESISSGDHRWLMELSECIGSAASAGMLTLSDAAGLARIVRDAVRSELEKAESDDYKILKLISLIEDVEGSESVRALPVFADRANAIVQQNLRSSALALAFHCAQLVLPEMSADQRHVLLGAAVDYCENLLPSDEDMASASAAVAKTLASLASLLPDERDRVVLLLRGMAQRDISVLPALGRLAETSLQEAAECARLAEIAMFSGSADRWKTLRSIAGWLQTRAARATAEPILEVLLGIAASDSPDTRVMALGTLSSYFRAHPDSAPDLRMRAVRVAAQIVRHDKISRVRVRAMTVVASLTRNAEERAQSTVLIGSLEASRIAIERRVAELGKRLLAAGPGTLEAPVIVSPESAQDLQALPEKGTGEEESDE